jgi:hypothetical protein
MEVGINQAAKITRKNKSVIWRDEKAGKLSSKANGKGHKVYDIAELERVYGQIYDPAQDETAETVAGKVASDQTQPDIEAVKLALKLEFIERELSLIKDQLTEIKTDRDHWRNQAETALRALPPPAVTAPQPEPEATVPVSATNNNQPKPSLWQRLTGARA